MGGLLLGEFRHMLNGWHLRGVSGWVAVFLKETDLVFKSGTPACPTNNIVLGSEPPPPLGLENLYGGGFEVALDPPSKTIKPPKKPGSPKPPPKKKHVLGPGPP